VKSKRCWLSDPDFLPKYVPKARVLVWGYNASFSSLVGEQPSGDRIHHHAQTLVANLGAERRVCHPLCPSSCLNLIKVPESH
jgi:protein SERAC1